MSFIIQSYLTNSEPQSRTPERQNTMPKDWGYYHISSAHSAQDKQTIQLQTPGTYQLLLQILPSLIAPIVTLASPRRPQRPARLAASRPQTHGCPGTRRANRGPTRLRPQVLRYHPASGLAATAGLGDSHLVLAASDSGLLFALAKVQLGSLPLPGP